MAHKMEKTMFFQYAIIKHKKKENIMMEKLMNLKTLSVSMMVLLVMAVLTKTMMTQTKKLPSTRHYSHEEYAEVHKNMLTYANKIFSTCSKLPGGCNSIYYDHIKVSSLDYQSEVVQALEFLQRSTMKDDCHSNHRNLKEIDKEYGIELKDDSWESDAKNMPPIEIRKVKDSLKKDNEHDEIS